MRLLLTTLVLIGLAGCESKVDVEADKVDVEAPLDALKRGGDIGWTRESGGKITSIRLTPNVTVHHSHLSTPS